MNKFNYVINAGDKKDALEPVSSGKTIDDCKNQIISNLNKEYKYIEITYSPVDDTEIDKVIWVNKALEKARSRDLKESYRADELRLTAEITDILAANGYDVDDEDVRNYIDSAVDLAFEEYLSGSNNSITDIANDWFEETKTNYPEDLASLKKFNECNENIVKEDFDPSKEDKYIEEVHDYINNHPYDITCDTDAEEIAAEICDNLFDCDYFSTDCPAEMSHACFTVVQDMVDEICESDNIFEASNRDIDTKRNLNDIYKFILAEVTKDVAISDIKNDPNIGFNVDIEPSDEAINKVIENLEARGFIEVDRYIDDEVRTYVNDSYIVFAKEEDNIRIVVGIVFNGAIDSDYAFVNCGYDEVEDGEYFIESLNEAKKSLQIEIPKIVHYDYVDAMIESDENINNKEDIIKAGFKIKDNKVYLPSGIYDAEWWDKRGPAGFSFKMKDGNWYEFVIDVDDEGSVYKIVDKNYNESIDLKSIKKKFYSDNTPAGHIWKAVDLTDDEMKEIGKYGYETMDDGQKHSYVKLTDKEYKEIFNESIENATIDEIEDFIEDTKIKFPGSEAYYDGDKNTIVINLSKDINESLDMYAYDETNKDDQILYDMIGQDIADVFATKYKILEFNDFNGENDEFDKAIDNLIKVYKSAKDISKN